MPVAWRAKPRAEAPAGEGRPEPWQAPLLPGGTPGPEGRGCRARRRAPHGVGLAATTMVLQRVRPWRRSQ